MAEPSPRRPGQPEPRADGETDVVEEASEQSFPASDAPGWAIGRDHDPTQAVPAVSDATRAIDRQRDDPATPWNG